MSGEALDGTCFCGQVAFRVEPPTKWCAHCHCSMCQRVHGAAVVTWVGVAEDRLHFTRGAESLRWFASSPDSRRGFCPRCGSSLFFRSERWPGEVHVVRTSLPAEIDREVEGNAFVESHPAWFDLTTMRSDED
jgi:hypothetical protein